MSKRPFIDKEGLRGRPRLSPQGEIQIPAKSPSRSLESIKPSNKTLKLEILKNGCLVIDTSQVIGDKVRVSKMFAMKLAKWILSVYGHNS